MDTNNPLEPQPLPENNLPQSDLNATPTLPASAPPLTATGMPAAAPSLNAQGNGQAPATPTAAPPAPNLPYNSALLPDAPYVREQTPGQTAMANAPISDLPLHAPVMLKPDDPAANDAEVEKTIRRMSRRSFLWGAAGIATTYGLWRGINIQRQADGIGWPFRLALQANENLARDYFAATRLAPTFTNAQIGRLPVNGTYGADPDDDFELADWKLHVVGLEDAGDEEGGRAITLADIKKLPRTEMITELKCIEGWSSIVQWAGVRLADFVAHYKPAKIDDAMPQYVAMETPDKGYYVGLDMESALHPQTLLCYEMNGKPLTYEHGAPLRLVIPVKYGIKNIKRIGTITFTNDRPKDYWAEQGYDWYAGH